MPTRCKPRATTPVGKTFPTGSGTGTKPGKNAVSGSACISVVYPMPSQLRPPSERSGGFVDGQRTSTCLSPKRSISFSKALRASQSLFACPMRSSAVAKIALKSTPRSITSHSSPAYFADKAARASPRSSSQACRSKGPTVCAGATDLAAGRSRIAHNVTACLSAARSGLAILEVFTFASGLTAAGSSRSDHETSWMTCESPHDTRLALSAASCRIARACQPPASKFMYSRAPRKRSSRGSTTD